MMHSSFDDNLVKNHLERWSRLPWYEEVTRELLKKTVNRINSVCILHVKVLNKTIYLIYLHMLFLQFH
jgi:hypothetical protein